MTVEQVLLWLVWLLGVGFIGTAIAGLLITFVDRKVTARVQYRVGPPWYQPFADVVKLLGKETIVPRGASRLAFFGSPLVAVASAALVSAMLWAAILRPAESFVGDVFVVVYLLVLPSLALVLGGAAARNPLAAVGASREMKLVLGYELPFILALTVVFIKSGGQIRLAQLLAFQSANGAFAVSLSGALALIVMVPVIQAKLGLVPFDQAEAETELMGGALIEYSGAPLAAFKLAKAMLYFTLPVFAVVVLCGGMPATGVGPFVLGLLKVVGLVVVAVLIRNTNPRVRIEHAVRFFWGPVTAVAAAAVVLALLGESFGIGWL